MTSPGATELLIVLVIVLLILGPKRLPSLGRQLGGGIREFRRSFGGGSGSPDGAPREGVREGAASPASSETLTTSPPTAPTITADPGETVAGEVDSERRPV